MNPGHPWASGQQPDHKIPEILLGVGAFHVLTSSPLQPLFPSPAIEGE